MYGTFPLKQKGKSVRYFGLHGEMSELFWLWQCRVFKTEGDQCIKYFKEKLGKRVGEDR